MTWLQWLGVVIVVAAFGGVVLTSWYFLGLKVGLFCWGGAIILTGLLALGSALADGTIHA